jgi:hypothetical protein
MIVAPRTSWVWKLCNLRRRRFVPLLFNTRTRCMEPKGFPFVERSGPLSNARDGRSRLRWRITSGGSFSASPFSVQRIIFLALRCETADDADGDWERRRDEEIQLAVITALHWDLAVPRNSVEVTVKGGWVTLTGQVRRAYEKSCSEASGVIGATNKIECTPGVIAE